LGAAKAADLPLYRRSISACRRGAVATIAGFCRRHGDGWGDASGTGAGGTFFRWGRARSIRRARSPAVMSASTIETGALVLGAEADLEAST
jgi:hypothetical protein